MTAGRAQDIEAILEEAEEELRKEREEKRQREVAKRARLRAKVKYSSRKINPFDALDIAPPSDTGTYQEPPSEAMSNLLMKQGVDPDGLTYNEAKKLCGTIVQRLKAGLCTIKQAALLGRYGYGSNFTREQASGLIDRIKANGWKKPE